MKTALALVYRALAPVVASITLMTGVAWAQQAAPVTPAGALPAVESVNVNDLSPIQQQVVRDQTQPANNAPVWRQVQSGGSHYSAITTPEAGVLIQQGGHEWRLVRSGVITVYGGWVLVLALSAIGAFYLIKGEMKLSEGRSGRLIQRFNDVERWAHWSMAISFCILAVSGVLILFGRYVLLPVLGGGFYGPLLLMLKNVHNVIGPFFTLSTIVFFVLYAKDNIPSARDLAWFKNGGHGPSERFNGGEKLWFWAGVTFLGLVVSVSGWVLNSIVPGVEYFSRADMQLANIVHGVGSILFLAMAMGHIYIGSIGTEGALDGMTTGHVDENWGKEHHSIWYEAVKSGADHRGRSDPH